MFEKMKICLPPDPNTKKPSFMLPAGSCDTHCHIFGPEKKFPYHPNRTYTPPDATRHDLKKLHRKLGIKRAVIVQATCHGNDNSAMLDAISYSRDSYRGIAMVDETITEIELEKMNIGGIRGTRFSFARHLSGPPNFDKINHIVRKYEPLGWHAVLYLEAKDIVENIQALVNFPVPVVIDHMARVKVTEGVEQKAFQLLLDLVRNEDFWVKISGAERLSKRNFPYEDVVPYARALIEASPDRILWGTDWPHPNIPRDMPNDGDLLDMLVKFAPDKVMRKKILVENPQQLYGF